MGPFLLLPLVCAWRSAHWASLNLENGWQYQVGIATAIIESLMVAELQERHEAIALLPNWRWHCGMPVLLVLRRLRRTWLGSP
ncbi:uncharacterized protein BJ171DRAFT_256853 [Polychytrium aggregatum]|uniref:uncharacterized protein n=1 Tax=Polychytrium aggregatum TaxID=110093 RepID=UPI0022FE3FF2|nr:uncharacterized protein BJ171DRAFT_256853 [Polychytrium aggregatum]KAI9207885.1 hypothetical protein BJ171DRAFT_256853 [Polychytrium aggregatum]